MAEQQQNTDSSLIATEIPTTFHVEKQKSFLSKHKYSLVLILLGFYFLAFAIAELITNYSENSYTTPLDCTTYECIGVSEPTNFDNGQTVYFYLTNSVIAQNDISSTLEQKNDNLSTCSSYSRNEDGQKIKGIDLSILNPSDGQYPCGMFISYFPGESFTVVNRQNGLQLPIQSVGLDDLNISYENQNGSQQWANVTQGRFRVWNEKQTSIGTKKLWGISTGLSSGSLLITLSSVNPIHEKLASNLNIVVTDNGALSGYNLPWCIINFLFSLSVFVMGCVSCWYKQKIENLINDTDDIKFTTISLIRAHSPPLEYFEN